MIHTLWHNFSHWKVWAGGVILIGLLLIATHCTPTATPIAQETPTREPPEITSFICIPSDTMLPGAKIGIHVNVKLHSNKIDDYQWFVEEDEGSIVSGQGESAITYQAPETPGLYKVRVELKYGGGSVRDSTIVEVVPESTPPPTEEPTAEPTEEPTEEPTKQSTAEPTEEPTEEPTPKPDAVVNTEALNLRSGPGLVYDILGVLKRGDLLKVTSRNLAGDWLKIIAPDGQEGWVAASLLQINLSLAGVDVAQAPPTPTPTCTPSPTPTSTPGLLPPPIPSAPANGESFIGGIVTFRWQWDRPLEQDEFFSLRVSREGETEPCHHAQVHGFEYSGGLSYCSAGKHYWQVALVRQLCEDCPEENKWQRISEPSEEQWIYYTPGEEPWELPPPPDKDKDKDKPPPRPPD